MRLKRRRLIGALFNRSSGQVQSIRSGTVRLVFRLADRMHSGSDQPIQIGFAVGKFVGNAVVRNRMKRIARETWRLNRFRLPTSIIPQGKVLTIMLVYRPSHPPGSESDLRANVEESISRLAQAMNQDDFTGRALHEDSQRDDPAKTEP